MSTSRPLSLIDPPSVSIPPEPAPFVDHCPLPTMPTRVDIENDDLTTSTITPQAELLCWHYRLAHRSFKILRLLAYLRIIPYYLRLVHPLMCASYKYVKISRVPWRAQGPVNRGKNHPTTRAGECVSVEQIKSFTTGFLAQLERHITRRAYRAATVFLTIFLIFLISISKHLQTVMTL